MTSNVLAGRFVQGHAERQVVAGRAYDLWPAPSVVNDRFEFVEVFHHRQRRHSSLGYLCPMSFEELKQAT